MSALASYYLPGLYVEDHAIDVPLDWRGLEPALLIFGDTLRRGATPEPIPGAPESIKLFYRVVCAPEHVGEELPLMLYLQGGPGGASPRVTSSTCSSWLEEAVKHFRVILPDQRGTGRSSFVDGAVMERIKCASEEQGVDPARAQAEYLKRFLASSIVRDFEYLRLTRFGAKRWVTLGQSYGGFLTMTYLSLYPEGVAAAFTGGGIPGIPASADEVYAHTFPRMASKTRQYYERFPQDVERVGTLADRLSVGDVVLPDGSPFTVGRLQSLGCDFGMKPGPARVHNLIDRAFTDGAGEIPADHSTPRLSDGFLLDVLSATSTADRPLYWTLQEFIYMDGTSVPARWSAERAYNARPEFDPEARPLMFTGEATFRWMFDVNPALKPFKQAVELLMDDIEFDRIYDPVRLARNEVPLYAAVYYDDLYVDSGMQLDTLSRVGSSHAWVTNEHEHDGLARGDVLAHLLREALDHGDLERVVRGS